MFIFAALLDPPYSAEDFFGGFAHVSYLIRLLGMLIKRPEYYFCYDCANSVFILIILSGGKLILNEFLPHRLSTTTLFSISRQVKLNKNTTPRKKISPVQEMGFSKPKEGENIKYYFLIHCTFLFAPNSRPNVPFDSHR